MKLNVPYFKQESINDCGPVGVKMILSYFNIDTSLQKIKDSSLVDSSGITWTIGLSKVIKEEGLNVDFYSISI